MGRETAAHNQADEAITARHVPADEAFKVSVAELGRVCLITFAGDADAVDS